MILSIPSRSGPVIIVTTIIIDHGHWGRVICLPTSRGEGFTIPNFGHEKAATVWKIFSGGGAPLYKNHYFGPYKGFLMFIIYVKG